MYLSTNNSTNSTLANNSYLPCWAFWKEGGCAKVDKHKHLWLAGAESYLTLSTPPVLAH